MNLTMHRKTNQNSLASNDRNLEIKIPTLFCKGNISNIVYIACKIILFKLVIDDDKMREIELKC